VRGLHRLDPGLFGLKRAARAAIVMPAVFAFADKVVANPQTATFAAFGSFAILVFADFGGPRRIQLVAYLCLAATGAVFIVLGTLCSRDPWVAAAAMAVVAFAVLYSAAISGYFVAGATAAMLTFVLPVNIPADPSVIPARLEGWGLASAVGVAAVLLLWPGQPRDKLRAEIASACRALADLLECEVTRNSALVAQRATSARKALGALRREFLSAPYRPTGPTDAAAGIAFLVDELDWFQSFNLRAWLVHATARHLRWREPRAARGRRRRAPGERRETRWGRRRARSRATRPGTRHGRRRDQGADRPVAAGRR
jgi:hypothetical protein